MTDPFNYVQPCVPDCTPAEHAYHQGQWDMAVRMTEARRKAVEERRNIYQATDLVGTSKHRRNTGLPKAESYATAFQTRLRETLLKKKYLQASVDPTLYEAITEAFRETIQACKPDIPYKKLEPCVYCGSPQYNHDPDGHFEYATNLFETALLEAIKN